MTTLNAGIVGGSCTIPEVFTGTLSYQFLFADEFGGFTRATLSALPHDGNAPFTFGAAVSTDGDFFSAISLTDRTVAIVSPVGSSSGVTVSFVIRFGNEYGTSPDSAVYSYTFP